MVRARVFSPRGASSAEGGLRYYASQFSVVEADATYYFLPERATAELWAERIWFLPTPESTAVLAEAAEQLSGILPPSSFAMPRGSTRHDTQLERSTCCVTWD